MCKSVSILSTIIGLAFSAASLQAQVIDCGAQSADLEPAGYDAQCGPFDTAPGPGAGNAPNAPNAPTDMGTAVDVRGDVFAIDSLLSFTINDFPGMTSVAVTNNRVFALDYDETGTVLYAIPGTTATANPNTLITIDPATGVATPIAALTGAPDATGMTIDPTTGDAYIVDATNFYSLDLTTAVATLIGTTDVAATMVDVAMNCEGQVFAHDIISDSLFSIDPVTGAGTVVGGTGLAANFAQGMDFDNDDGTLYGFVYTGGGTNTFGSFNLATGAVTALSTNNPLGEFIGAFPGTCPAVDADVSVTKTAAAPNPLLVGSTVTYTLTAANAGPGDAGAVVVTDSLPAQLTYVSNTCAATVVGQDVTWNIGVLANGANATCDIVSTVNAFGPIANTANIASSSMDLIPGNNTATASLAGVPFPVTQIPTLGQLGMLLLVLILAVAGVIVIRRQSMSQPL